MIQNASDGMISRGQSWSTVGALRLEDTFSLSKLVVNPLVNGISRNVVHVVESAS